VLRELNGGGFSRQPGIPGAGHYGEKQADRKSGDWSHGIFVRL